MEASILNLKQRFEDHKPISNQELQFMLDYIGHRDGKVRDQLIYSLFCHAFDRQMVSVEQANYIVGYILGKNLLHNNVDKADVDSALIRSFSALTLAILLYADDQKEAIYYRFLSPEDRLKIMDLGIRHMAEESDATGYLEEFGWVHTMAHSSELLLSIVRHSLYDIALTEKVLSAIFTAFTKQKAVFSDKEEKRIGLVLVALRKQKLLRDSEFKAWIQRFHRHFDEAALEKIENLRAKENVANMLNFVVLFAGEKENAEVLRAVQELNGI